MGFKHLRSRAGISGLSAVELMIVVGLIAVVSTGMITMMNNLFKSVGSAQKSANRTDSMKAISTALSDKKTCSLAMGAGTLTIPTNWAIGDSHALSINRIQVGTDVLAEVGKVIQGIEVTSMKLEQTAGPYLIRYNVAAPSSPPDIRAYRRYFAKLTVTPKKYGGSQNNVGGEALRDSEFRLTFLVDDSNRLYDCFGGMDESDVAAICEKAFYGEYDAGQYPWCKINNLAIGMRMTDLPVMYRLAVKELSMATSPAQDATVLLSGNAGGNGPGVRFLPASGGGASMGAAEQAARFGNNTQPGDFAISAYRDFHVSTSPAPGLSPTRVIVKNNGQVGINTLDPKTAALKVENSTNLVTLEVHHQTSQGAIMISGPSDLGRTYSALYLSDNNDTDVQSNSWVFAHKGPSEPGSPHHSLQINRWSGGTMWGGIAITPTMRVGVGVMDPSEKLHVLGNVLTQGNFRATGTGTFDSNVTVTGTVTASSDRRLKKDIQVLDSSLEKILRLEPVSFLWRDEKISSQRQIGFVAQDVEKVLPELVSTNDKGIRSVAYGNLVAVVVGALKKVYQMIHSLSEKFEASENRVNELEKNVKILLQRQEENEQKRRALEEKLVSCQENGGKL